MKVLIIGVLIGIVFGVALGPQISEALYSIPPTNAWQTIGIDNNVVFPNSSDPTISAISYRDTLYLVSDGSILINITSYP